MMCEYIIRSEWYDDKYTMKIMGNGNTLEPTLDYARTPISEGYYFTKSGFGKRQTILSSKKIDLGCTSSLKLRNQQYNRKIKNTE